MYGRIMNLSRNPKHRLIFWTVLFFTALGTAGMLGVRFPNTPETVVQIPVAVSAALAAAVGTAAGCMILRVLMGRIFRFL